MYFHFTVFMLFYAAQVTDEDIQAANQEYQSLSDLVLWSLPNVLLQPLLVRLQLDVGQKITEQSAKKWLLSADPALRSVVIKEALQWKRGPVSQVIMKMSFVTEYFIIVVFIGRCPTTTKS